MQLGCQAYWPVQGPGEAAASEAAVQLSGGRFTVVGGAASACHCHA